MSEHEMPFETWCRISATRLQRDEERRAEILASHGIDAFDWEDANAHWLAEIGAGIAGGDHTLADAYAAACVAELASRREGTDRPSVDATVLAAAIDVAAEGAVPFQGACAAPPPRAPLERHPSAGDTASVDLDDLGVNVTCPFGANVAAGEDDIDRYAAIVAATDGASPARRQEVHQHYGLASELARRSLDQRMSAALRDDAGLRRRFESELERWRVYLRAVG